MSRGAARWSVAGLSMALVVACGAKTGLYVGHDNNAGGSSGSTGGSAVGGGAGSGSGAGPIADASPIEGVPPSPPIDPLDAGPMSDADAADASDAADAPPDVVMPIEICNGLDDDGNGIIDDGFNWVVQPDDPVRVSTDASDHAQPSGTASNFESYVAFYEGGTADSLNVFATVLDRFGETLFPEEPLSPQVTHSHGGTVHARAIAWSGDRYGLAWIDLRGGSGEIYFAALGPDGAKVAPGDVKVSDQGSSSFNPSLDWTGESFVVVWSDDPSSPTSFPPPRHIYARSVGLDGTAQTPSVRVSDSSSGDPTGPFVSAADGKVAVAWIDASDDSVQVALRDTSLQTELWGPITVTPSGSRGDYVRVARLRQGWAVFWHGKDDGERTIWGAVLRDSGQLSIPAAIVVETPRHARYPYPVSLGDRILLVYSDDRDDEMGYEIYKLMLNSALEPMEDPQRVSRTPADSIFPGAAFGPEGDLGISFRDDQLGWGQVYFTRLECEQD